MADPLTYLLLIQGVTLYPECVQRSKEKLYRIVLAVQVQEPTTSEQAELPM